MGNKKSKPKVQSEDERLLQELEEELRELEGQDLSSEEFDVVQEISYASEEPPELASGFLEFYQAEDEKIDMLSQELSSLRVETPEEVRIPEMESVAVEELDNYVISEKIQRIQEEINTSEANQMSILESEAEKVEIPKVKEEKHHTLQKRRQEKHQLENKIRSRREDHVSKLFWDMACQLFAVKEAEAVARERQRFREMDQYSAKAALIRLKELEARVSIQNHILRCQERVMKKEKDALDQRKRLEQRKAEETKRIKRENQAQMKRHTLHKKEVISNMLVKMKYDKMKLIRDRVNLEAEALADEVCSSVLCDTFAWILAQHIWKSIRRDMFQQWSAYAQSSVLKREEIHDRIARSASIRVLRLSLLRWKHRYQTSALIRRIWSRWTFRTHLRKQFRRNCWNRFKFSVNISRREKHVAAVAIQAYFKRYHVMKCLQELKPKQSIDFDDFDFLDEKDFVFDDLEDDLPPIVSGSFSLGSLISSSESLEENDSYGQEMETPRSRPITIESIRLPPSEHAAEIDVPVRSFLEKPSLKVQAVTKDWGFESKVTSKAWLKRQKRFKNKKKKKKPKVVPFVLPISAKKRQAYPMRQNAWE